MLKIRDKIGRGEVYNSEEKLNWIMEYGIFEVL